MRFNSTRPAATLVLLAMAVAVLAAFGACGCGHDRVEGSTPPGEAPAHHDAERSWPTSIPGTGTLPFPPNEIERTWPVGPDKTLVAQRLTENEFDLCYHLAAHGQCTTIVEAMYGAEVQSVSPSSIQFVCHRYNDTPFIAFPYLLIYDVASGTKEEHHLPHPPGQAVEFGGWGIEKGQLLTLIELAQGGVKIQFGTAKETLPAYPGPIPYIPHTAAQWSSERGALTLRFRGTEPVPAAVEEVATIAGGCLLSASLDCDGNDALLSLYLDQPREYYITHTYGAPCTMTVHFAQ